jgi:hypothetical protein
LVGLRTLFDFYKYEYIIGCIVMTNNIRKEMTVLAAEESGVLLVLVLWLPSVFGDPLHH